MSSADDATVPPGPDAPVRRRDLAVARSLDSARVRSEGRVQRFLDAGFELLASAESGRDFTVQEVVDRSGQSLRSFYQYFAGKHELLLALFDEAIRSTAGRLEDQLAKERTPLERLHRFVVEYYRMCLPAPKGRASKNNPTPVLAEFCHQLLTAHQEEASRAFVPLVALLEKTLADAVEAGAVHSSYAGEDVAGSILATIMFNAAYASTISGTESHDSARAGDEMWEFVARGIATGSK
ncbi:MAG TPA: TetR/AcrR family transcriptional regulator [Acidimicrobiales bacterium]|jgi:AcrR family transcriptional regulator|nr:TetR/AcrR family transcriptional regulator [Acidimicrobiales bacterium]